MNNKNNSLNCKPWLSWESILINGKELPRIRFKSKPKEPDKCDGCGAKKGCFHLLGCQYDKSPCAEHEFLIDCICDIRPGEEV